MRHFEFTHTIEQRVYGEFPAWMQEAIKRNKIAAIKELRAAGGTTSEGNHMTLLHSKNIVEGFMSGIHRSSI